MTLFSPVLALFGCTEQPWIQPLCDEDPGTSVALSDTTLGTSADALADAISRRSIHIHLEGTGYIVDSSVQLDDSWSFDFEPEEAELVEVRGAWQSSPASRCQAGARLDIRGTSTLTSAQGLSLELPVLVSTWSADPGDAWLSATSEPIPVAATSTPYADIAAAHSCSDGSTIDALRFEAFGAGFDFDPADSLGAAPLFAVTPDCGDAFLHGSGTMDGP